MADDNKHIGTPAFDALEPKMQAFVTTYCQRFQLKESGVAGGVTPRMAHKTAKKWLERDDIAKAVAELMMLKRGEAERAKSSLVERLLIQSTVCLDDLTEWSLSEKKLVIKPPHKIDPEFRCCAHFAQYTREGAVSFQGTWQRDAIRQLSALMLWDKEGRDDLPPITFDFGSLKRSDYKAPE